MDTSNLNINTCLIIATSFVSGFFMGRSFRSATKSIFNRTGSMSLQTKNVKSERTPSEWEILSKCTKPLKLVLVLRQDLKLTKGKAASQCAHGTLSAFKKISKEDPATLKAWERIGQAKIVVKAPNIDTIHSVEKEADKVGLITSFVYDAGRTQVDPGTLTVMSVGPGPIDLVDKVTGHLKLY